MKRVRTLTAKPGELKVGWGRADAHSDPDLCCAWGPWEHRVSPDARMLLGVLSDKRMRYGFPKMDIIYEPSLREELEARGYDITTLKISIQKKTKTDGEN